MIAFIYYNITLVGGTPTDLILHQYSTMNVMFIQINLYR